MFTIDLLKGQGIPKKSGPEGILVAVATFAIPLVAGMVMFGFYVSDRIVTSVRKQEIANYQASIDGLSDAAELQESFTREKGLLGGCLSEVAGSLCSHSQWSGVLVTLVENMPDSMVLTKLEVKQSSVKKKVPQKDDPKKMIDISVPVRTLRMSVCGSSEQNYDDEIRDFRNRLRFSELLVSRLEDIRVAQGVEKLEDRDVVSYEIDCIFKPEL
ncbi:MAG: hypothetical protein JSV99_01055 [Planctomycetota bacterium]|nr:MAG: hypothetical protein JSV99_01055 [Planctomycetota bacterium]